MRTGAERGIGGGGVWRGAQVGVLVGGERVWDGSRREEIKRFARLCLCVLCLCVCGRILPVEGKKNFDRGCREKLRGGPSSQKVCRRHSTALFVTVCTAAAGPTQSEGQICHSGVLRGWACSGKVKHQPAEQPPPASHLHTTYPIQILTRSKGTPASFARPQSDSLTA